MRCLVFSPYAYFDVHALPEALVAQSLINENIEVLYVKCDGIYSKSCLCFSGINYSDVVSKKKICRECKLNKLATIKEFNFKSISIEDYITDKTKLETNKILSSLKKNQYQDLIIDNIPIGAYASYEFFLTYKLNSKNIPLSLFEEYEQNLINCIETFFGIKNIFNEFNVDRLVTYNSLYSLNRVACAVADKFKVPHFSIHAGGHHVKRIQQISIFKGVDNIALVNKHKLLDINRKLPCTKYQINFISEHIFELFKATSPWVYSLRGGLIQSKQLKNKLGIRKEQKVLLAVMRSGDERFAAILAGMSIFTSKPIFDNQIDWLNWLVNFAKENPNFYIIFRIHPREFSNKRDKINSTNGEKIRLLTKSLDIPNNFFFNFPEDNYSLYDLLKITDLVLNNSSTAGLEASLFGIPVLGIGDDLFSFDPALQTEPSSIIEYKKYIHIYSKSGWSFERVIQAYRWYRFIFDNVAIDISDGYKLPFKVQFFNHVLMKVINFLKRLNLLPEYLRLIMVKNRPYSLINSNYLVYAIKNNEDSHIHEKNIISGNSKTERKLIEEAFKKYMFKISHQSDIEFTERVNSVLKQLN